MLRICRPLEQELTQKARPDRVEIIENIGAKGTERLAEDLSSYSQRNLSHRHGLLLKEVFIANYTLNNADCLLSSTLSSLFLINVQFSQNFSSIARQLPNLVRVYVQRINIVLDLRGSRALVILSDRQDYWNILVCKQASIFVTNCQVDTYDGASSMCFQSFERLCDSAMVCSDTNFNFHADETFLAKIEEMQVMNLQFISTRQRSLVFNTRAGMPMIQQLELNGITLRNQFLRLQRLQSLVIVNTNSRNSYINVGTIQYLYIEGLLGDIILQGVLQVDTVVLHKIADFVPLFFQSQCAIVGGAVHIQTPQLRFTDMGSFKEYFSTLYNEKRLIIQQDHEQPPYSDLFRVSYGRFSQLVCGKFGNIRRVEITQFTLDLSEITADDVRAEELILSRNIIRQGSTLAGLCVERLYIAWNTIYGCRFDSLHVTCLVFHQNDIRSHNCISGRGNVCERLFVQQQERKHDITCCVPSKETIQYDDQLTDTDQLILFVTNKNADAKRRHGQADSFLDGIKQRMERQLDLQQHLCQWNLELRQGGASSDKSADQ